MQPAALLAALAALAAAMPQQQRVPVVDDAVVGAPHHSDGSVAPRPVAPANATAAPPADDVPAGLGEPVFGARCEGVTLGGHGARGRTTLAGRCADAAGNVWRASLNLNLCLGVRNGRLVYAQK